MITNSHPFAAQESRQRTHARREFFERAQKPLFEVNERLIALLTATAAEPNKNARPEPSINLGEVLLDLNAAQRQQVAHSSFLLADVNFHDANWWHAVSRRPGKASKDNSPCANGFPRRAAAHLAHSTLVLAWHFARTEPQTLGIFLGIPSDTADIISDLPLQTLERVAERQCNCLRPRWENRPLLWLELLMSAQQADETAATKFKLHALQVAASDLIQRRPMND